MPEASVIQSMFGRIASRYDAANRVLSAGLDKGWRRALVGAAAAAKPSAALDLATGSGDVAFALARVLPPQAEIVGMDFCVPMLAEAEKKRESAGAGPISRVKFVLGDALNIPAADSSFEVVTISFGIRNVSDRPRALREIRRVLRPGGTLLILEFSQPSRWVRPLYFFYLRRILPLLGGMIAGDADAYRYLNASIEAFPGRAALESELRAAGFARVTSRALCGCAVALHQGWTS